MIVSNIIPECYVDTKVAEIVSQSSKRYNHQHGAGNVANKLKKDFRNRPALGITDEDKYKIQPKHWQDFAVKKQENNLILKHDGKAQFLIVICPAIEKWLLHEADTVQVNPSADNFNLPYQLTGFAQLCKLKDIDKNIGFYRFIKELIKREAPGIIKLSEWISLFKQNEIQNLLS